MQLSSSTCQGDSPRTIKRFVNVYRILRTGLSGEDLAALCPRVDSYMYRAIIAQLAIVTGAPALADAYFDALGPPERRDGKTTSSVAAALAGRNAVTASSEWKSLKGALDALTAVDDSAGMLEEMRKRANVVKRFSFNARPLI